MMMRKNATTTLGVALQLRLVLCVCVLYSCIGVAQGTDGAKVFRSELSEAERSELMEVIQAERELGVLTPTSDIESSSRLRSLLEVGRHRFMISHFPFIQQRYLTLLLSELTNAARLSASDAREIETVALLGDADERVERYRRRIQWMLKIRSMSDASERVRFVTDYMRDLSDGYYYAFQAMDELVLHGSAGMEPLSQLVESHRTQPLDSGLLQKAHINLEKLRLLNSISALSTAEKVSTLKGALFRPMRYSGVLVYDFHLWVVRQLLGCGPAAAPVLQQVVNDSSVPFDVRRAAGAGQSGLVR
jgi:hypothetical protein